MHEVFREFLIRNWQPKDRQPAAQVISAVLQEYGLPWQPQTADRDVLAVEDCYLETGGEFWVVELNSALVGTAAYLPIKRGNQAVEIRKMYLLPHVRGQGLGQYILNSLEKAIAIKNYQEIWVETASVLIEAVKLYQKNGYQPTSEVETDRCDLAYIKQLERSSAISNQLTK